MTVFDIAAGVLFRDPNITSAASYQPVAGYPAEVRVARVAPQESFGFGDARISSSSVSFQVHRADVAAPQAGDVIVCDGETRIVQGVPELDAERLFWTLDTRPG